MKIALIVPSTTKGLDIDDITDTHLYKILIESLSKDKPKKHKITIYVGYDNDDKIYSNSKQRLKLNALCEKVDIVWVEQNVEKGHVTEIWNNLGHRAVQDNFEYMYVCGDDIEIDNNKWMNDWIPKLKENNNIGWVAGYSHNDRIATQFLIHKTHIDIFGFVYPKEIKNWGCDDWIFGVYNERFRIWLKEYRHLNIGGQPRYEVEHNPRYYQKIIERYRKILYRYLSSKK
jgi:hypothetical protein